MAYSNVSSANIETLGMRVSRLITPLITRYKRHRLYRATFDGLNALTQRELADLGLHRSELHHVALESAAKADI
ncbi:DUF1127 domain-containing protein [Sulfitobacter sp. F26204]|uniref:DUF1127 domain-containing protein n=1 Tax=Sulfitobacter sp. F26204 TaxID=2996014 RepID=UPI00225DEB69|nr:DUF1127 domain-containing protein [Sulfitobacter sp. F26204]MCX7559332.1 DUF1127 domain-containing protein [Sulfitobacter sp. F26204]